MCPNRDFYVEFQRFNSGKNVLSSNKHRNTANAKRQIERSYLFINYFLSVTVAVKCFRITWCVRILIGLLIADL